VVGREMAKLPPNPTKSTKCLDDNVEVCVGLFPIAPREMAYFNLAYAHAKPYRLGKNFGIDHRTHAPDLNVVENCTSEQFESAIDISNFDAQHYSYQDIPSPAHCSASGGRGVKFMKHCLTVSLLPKKAPGTNPHWALSVGHLARTLAT